MAVPAYTSVIVAITLCCLLSGCEGIKNAIPNSVRSGYERDSLQKAEDFKKSGNYEEALRIYRELTSHPEAASTAPYIEMAKTYRKMRRAEQAVDLLEEARKHHPGSQELLRQLGYSLIDYGKPEQAIMLFDQLITMAPDNPLAYNGKAVAFDNSGNHLAAQELYQKALSFSPNSPSIQNNLAMSMILNNQLDEAIILLENILKRSPSLPKASENLALAYRLKGEKESAPSLGGQSLQEKQVENNPPLPTATPLIAPTDGHVAQ